jgi:hypothetical protein
MVLLLARNVDLDNFVAERQWTTWNYQAFTSSALRSLCFVQSPCSPAVSAIWAPMTCCLHEQTPALLVTGKCTALHSCIAWREEILHQVVVCEPTAS